MRKKELSKKKEDKRTRCNDLTILTDRKIHNSKFNITQVSFPKMEFGILSETEMER